MALQKKDFRVGNEIHKNLFDGREGCNIRILKGRFADSIRKLEIPHQIGH
jgi:hypothetical protein